MLSQANNFGGVSGLSNSSSQNKRCPAAEAPQNISLTQCNITSSSLNSTKDSSFTEKWTTLKRRRFLISKRNLTKYNLMHCFRRMFMVCWPTSFETSAEIVLLGKVYDGSEMDRIAEDIKSRIYFSYRAGFDPLNHPQKSMELRSDAGWGCTIRTGQMLMAEGFLRHLLGRDYRSARASDYDRLTIQRIQRMFYDQLAMESPFSIHTLTSIAFREYGKKPGEWYNPSMVGNVMYKAMLDARRSAALIELSQTVVYVAQDNCIFADDLLECCGVKNDGASGVNWRSPLLFIPVRLGVDHVNSAYFECLQKFLENRYSIGFIGGRESSSYYFMGYQQNELVYLDPHYVQDSEARESSNYHASQVKKMAFKHLRPSCMLGFYCKTTDELKDFLNSVNMDTQAYERGSRKVFHLVEVCEGSSKKFESKATFKMRRSMGSMEILSLFEQSGINASVSKAK